MASSTFATLSTIAVVLLVCQLSVIEAVPTKPTNCSLFRYVMGGTEAIGVYSARLYNYPHVLESNKSRDDDGSIATDLFEGLRLIAVAGLYSRLMHSVADNPLLQNYSGFNNLNMPGFFASMLSNIIKDVCNWLVSYGDAITLRPNINCSHPAEQLMLSEFAMVIPIVQYFELSFEDQFGCTHVNFQDWIREFMLDDFQPEINYLEGLVDHPLSIPDSKK